MIELDTLNRLLAIEYNYEQLLRLHEQLIHEHEELKDRYGMMHRAWYQTIDELNQLKEDIYWERITAGEHEE